MSTLLVTTSVMPSVAYADQSSDSTSSDTETSPSIDASSTSKKETVYSKADASGKTSGIYVVNYFNTTAATDVSDPGSYTELTNMSSSEDLTDTDGKVNLTTLAGEPFYYQGDLDSSTQLPWDVEITYTLDGKQVSPDELAGQDGDLDIELKITGLSDDSATADFAKSFVLQAQGTFPNANFNVSDSDGATTAISGDNTLLTYLLLPDSDGDYHIKGSAKDFSYSGWQISAMPLSTAINVRDYDTSDLSNASDELDEGTSQLTDGGASLQSGLSELASGASSAASGASTLASGASALSSGTDQLSSGAALLQSKLEENQGSFSTLREGASEVSSGVSALRTTLSETMPGALLTANENVSDLKSQLSSIEQELGQIKSQASGLTDLQTSLTTHGQNVANDLKALQSSMTELSSVSDDLSSAGTDITAAATDAGTAAQHCRGKLIAEAHGHHGPQRCAEGNT